jgi:hypothetical protein
MHRHDATRHRGACHVAGTTGALPTEAALLVRLGYDAKGEQRLARLVRNFHPQFRTSFNGMVQVAEYFTGGSCGFQLNRTYVGKIDPVAIV